MGPGDKFSEDESGQVLYVQTPDGPVEVARKGSPEEEARENKRATFFGWICGVLAFAVAFWYFSNTVHFTVIATGKPLSYGELGGISKAFYVLYISLYSMMVASVAWGLSSIAALLFYGAKRVNFRQTWRALGKAKK
jgi:hypothetical protein